MKKDFITVSPDSGGGSTPLSVTADPNGFPVNRTTTLNFNADGGIATALNAVQEKMPFYCNWGINFEDRLSNVEAAVQCTPSNISMDTDPYGNEYLLQLLDYNLPNFSDVGDTVFYFTTSIILSTQFLSALNNSGKGNVTLMMLFEYQLSNGSKRTERLQFSQLNTISDGYTAYSKRSAVGMGDGGMKPVSLTIAAEYNDQNDNVWLFGWVFSQR